MVASVVVTVFTLHINALSDKRPTARDPLPLSFTWFLVQLRGLDQLCGVPVEKWIGFDQ